MCIMSYKCLLFVYVRTFDFVIDDICFNQLSYAQVELKDPIYKKAVMLALLKILPFFLPSLQQSSEHVYFNLNIFLCRPQHATRVFDMIDDFYVGDLRL